jgi:S1-C subfamily serine protease
MQSRLAVILVTVASLAVIGVAAVYASGRILAATPTQGAPGPANQFPGQPGGLPGNLPGGQPGAQALPQQGDLPNGQPGAQPGDQPGAPLPAEPGVVVVAVLPGSPAEQAGIQRGTIILAIDGREINAPEQLERVVAAHQPGDTVPLRVSNCAQPGEIPVTLSAAPDAAGGQNPRAWLGVLAVGSPAALPANQPNQPNQPNQQSVPGQPQPGSPVVFDNESGAPNGLGVMGVAPGSPAAQAGLQPGDVIVAVADARERPPLLLQRLRAAQPGETLALEIMRAGQPLQLAVTLGRVGDSPRAYFGVYAWSPVTTP